MLSFDDSILMPCWLVNTDISKERISSISQNLLDSEDGEITFLENVGNYLPFHTASHLKRIGSS